MRHRIAAAAATCALVALPAAADAAGYPGRERMDAVRDYLTERDGLVSVGVLDTDGRARGIRDRRRYPGASLVKAMLLVSYLRIVAAEGRELAAWERDQLRPMIHRSSNRAGSWVYARVGDVRLRSLARRAGMSDFQICCRWTNSWFSARDQARFFLRLERLTPRRYREYAVGLLSSIRHRQSWGIPRVAERRGFDVFHKPGWRPTLQGYLAHQAAYLSHRGDRFTVVVLSGGNPSYGYGIRTIARVAGRLLRGKPR